MMEQELGNFAIIQQLRETHRGIEDSDKNCGLLGVSIREHNNVLYLQQGDSILLCDVVSNVPISREKLDAPTVRFGPLDVFGRYISKSYIDKDSHFRIERITRYD